MKASQAATLMAGTLDIGKGEWGPLLTVCGIIFAAAMVSGLLPFAFVKVRWMDKVTAVGAGLCIGASLGLMIPEGFSLLQEAHEKDPSMNEGVGGFFLTLGMVFFVVLETVQETYMNPAASVRNVEATYAEIADLRSDDEDAEAKRKFKRSYRGWSTLLMMILHAASDGMVIGSVASTGEQDINAVVAFAMIAHKIPASFSLSSFLVALKWPAGAIFRGVLLFSLSSPLAAIVFFSLQYAVSATNFERMMSWIMLFSAGSILYVGFYHMYPEALKQAERRSGSGKMTMIWLVALGSLSAASFAFIPHDD